jgi:hypothetical protein
MGITQGTSTNNAIGGNRFSIFGATQDSSAPSQTLTLS